MKIVAEPAVVACRLHRAHEVVHRQVALAREVAEVPRPLQQVHVHLRGVGELHEGDPVRRNPAHRVGRQATGQNVPAVENDADPGVVGAANDLPGVAVVEDVTAPGQRLEAHLDAEAVGDAAQIAQVVRRPVDAAEAERRDVGADEDGASAQIVHQSEFALRPFETTGALRLGHSLEIAKRLEGDDLEAVVAHHRGDLGGSALVRKHVGLENLDAFETGRSDRGQLLGQAAAQRDSGDGESHVSSWRAWRSVFSSISRPWKIA